MWHEYKHGAPTLKAVPEDDEFETGERLLVEEEGGAADPIPQKTQEDKLGFRETAGLSLEFCMLWFFANYLASACLEYTSVASVMILSSTSSVWTLIFSAIFGVEAFSVRKLLGVMSSLVGIILISTVDLTGASDDDRGSFPHKTPTQVAIGDLMAFLGAVVYGIYVPVMKKRVGNEDRLDMRLLFGMIGVFNLLLLWPLFFILHWTDIEPVGVGRNAFHQVDT